MLAVPKSFAAATAAGQMRAGELAARVPAAGWQQVSCGDGAKGPRFYDWAVIATTSPDHHLLVRRSLTANGKGERERAYFTCHAPPGTTLSEMVAVAGTRWAIDGAAPTRRSHCDRRLRITGCCTDTSSNWPGRSLARAVLPGGSASSCR